MQVTGFFWEFWALNLVWNFTTSCCPHLPWLDSIDKKARLGRKRIPSSKEAWFQPTDGVQETGKITVDRC